LQGSRSTYNYIIKTGGQFAAKNGGQFGAKSGGQFTAKKGGHITRNLQKVNNFLFDVFFGIVFSLFIGAFDLDKGNLPYANAVPIMINCFLI
ncbi:MAG: hypothetical protein ACK5PC_01490, partial [Cyclobacteriaceae bacterium]